MDPVLEIDTRRKIFELIQANPGLHMREIARQAGLQLSLVEYHVNYLSDNDMVYAIREDRYSRFYVDDGFIDEVGGSQLTGEQKRILHLLRQELPLAIVVILLEATKATHKQLAEALEVAGSTLSYPLGKLVDAEVVVKVKAGEHKGYRLKDRKEVLKILILGKVKPPSQVENFIDMWEDLY